MLVSLTLVAGALPVAAADIDVSGKWKMTSTTPRGERVSEITLVQSSEKLTVTSKDREGNDVTSEGTVKGGEITWTRTRTTPQGEMVIAYKGKIDGKKMSGTMELGQMGSGDWKAERVE
jgi:hypothetical protein